MSGLSYVGGTTNTANGLMLLRTQIFNVTNGDRPDVPDIAFVITDGQSNVNQSDTIPEVRLKISKLILLIIKSFFRRLCCDKNDAVLSFL